MDAFDAALAKKSSPAAIVEKQVAPKNAKENKPSAVKTGKTGKDKKAQVETAEIPSTAIQHDAVAEHERLDMSEWDALHLHPKIVDALALLNFTQPTEIQKRALPLAIGKRRDIIGAAETGSGKTLAFGLPILNTLIRLSPEQLETCGLKALILTPTRELAIQVRDHMAAIAKNTSINVGAQSIMFLMSDFGRRRRNVDSKAAAYSRSASPRNHRDTWSFLGIVFRR
jgi:ATP-dependent RNA helicase DDX24/MAK5